MYFDKNTLTEHKALEPFTRYAKIIFDDRTIDKASLSIGVFRFGEDQTGPKHSHETEVEVYFCLKGEGCVIVDEKEFILKEGNILYIPPKAVHETKNVGNSDFEFLAIFSPCLNMDNIRQWPAV
ncbi:MAG: hypothetical protein APF76_15090 [Desulfitibacter sp. BRH_c19]|nr:MAG: hypothetical protein APF76_15090 [Desulfitibacter sp. BRH_c19]